MKRILRLLMYLFLGAIAGLMLSIIATGTSDINMDSIYYWIGMILLTVSIVLAVVSIYLYRQLKTVSGDYTKYMDMDAYDIYRYNKYNDLQVVNTMAMMMSVMSLAIFMIIEYHFMLILISGVTYLVVLYLTITQASLIEQLYPDRDLPKVGDKKYAEKLLASSDEGERHIMLNGLYKTHNFVQVGLFMGIVILIFYSIITGESQIFSIILIGVILILSQLKYSLEIREK
ncbi:DUF3169 family protein [Macrococcoides canis]|uniref:Uncharacterized protein DUF3169 n=1 Tax=Abyssicoccus albus TaxID=1817405 RepID=A0A3N5CJ31_9BACL|nr:MULTISPECIES: DUF3169 family protein [Staphylococcaceae]RPF57711.1 uncharacterized protein DUF3169 [Abyssicoccus albus]TDM19638.1 DUF3169 family protein [Macrococcus canis]TDM22543.1 DUF3169 family protein [Macrococcus canis]TDM35516.1 DUF3169 family protein [Macrococcus canis]